MSERFDQIRQRLLSASRDHVHEYPPEELRQLLDDARWLLHVYETGFDPDDFHAAAEANRRAAEIRTANERANQLTRDLNDMGAPLE
jgi:hypothetical protein